MFLCNESVVKESLLQIRGLHLDPYRISQPVDLSGILAADDVFVLIEIVIITSDAHKGDHSLYLRRLDFNVHAPLREPGNMAVEFLVDLVLHELDELVLGAVPLSVGRKDFTLRRMDTLLLVVILVLG